MDIQSYLLVFLEPGFYQVNARDRTVLTRSNSHFMDFSSARQADTEAPQPGTALIAVPLDQGLPHQQASGGENTHPGNGLFVLLALWKTALIVLEVKVGEIVLALVKKGNSRLVPAQEAEVFWSAGTLLRTFYDSVVESSAIFYGIVCWASSITDRDRRRNGQTGEESQLCPGMPPGLSGGGGKREDDG
ncbi:hypothetical protein L3Q82_001408 [Scortum barcoo]|uniref:Uncharacterized protein n=1 Tax=Scortum barcoo TaxID=214431 RepID=A0ACB8W708_9TELE|nr:hypothetical protein L3Q82_001408 [Scortum barcoo]